MEVILHQFLACVPVQKISWSLFHPTDDFQNQLFGKIFNHRVLESYPPSETYQMSFLKNWIKMVESGNYEVIEPVYCLYAKLIQCSPFDSDFSYKSYYLGNDKYVTLRESKHLVTKGTTGLHSWQASFELSEWIAEHKQRFNHKHIMELGSGVGLLGLATLHFASPASYTFSDCNQTVLDVLKANLMINNITNLDSVTVLELDWTPPVATLDAPVDFIIATDIVFDPLLIKSLVDFLEKALSVHSKAVSIIASTIRNEDTYGYFIDQLSE